jgi:hydroxyacylglutathione hydrolase
MNLLALPAFEDNYLWLLHDGRQALAVDPGDAAPVCAALEQGALELAGILVTHHHADHVGGLKALLARHPAPVFGPADDRLPVPVQTVADGERLSLLGLSLQVLEVPGHTATHVAYYTEPAGEAPLLFCGDTLFSAGCGRLFEGTPAQMLHSLERLSALPGDTRVCCAHEYTLSNLRFARAVEPDNAALAAYEAQCQATRAAGRPTVPAQLERERAINPFLRWQAPAVRAAALAHGAPSDDPVAVFAAIRQWKNEFR